MSKIMIGVIGLGYVGLPLARLFATKYPVTGFDTNSIRISQLKKGDDHTLEVSEADLKSVMRKNQGTGQGLFCTDKLEDIRNCNYYIITVPTPVDSNNRPDLAQLFRATESTGAVLKKNDVVIYESTVYPGLTEEECVPILEKTSGLVFNRDFYVGYSPERINPGDKNHTLEKILKVTSGSLPEIARQIDTLYRSVIGAGTYPAPSIKVAEAAKVIENSQRDINIAFVNELAKIFNLMGIDTCEVLKAAGTKWNFLPFRPGLVGGHCIGVDPYYLAKKAQEFGYHPEIILAGRRINDGMGKYVASEVVKMMIRNDIHIKHSRILVLGITFKENCPDVRNTKVVDVINDLTAYGADVAIYDPWASGEQVMREFNLHVVNTIPSGLFSAIILAVAHGEFLDMDLRAMLSPEGILYDVKGVLPCPVDGRL